MDLKTKHKHKVYELSIFFSYTFLWCSACLLCSARDTMRHGDRIYDDEAGGMFELGFFTANENHGGKRYVGIWYHKLSPKTVVWVANRKNPVLIINSSSTTGAYFGISEDGKLELFDDKGKSYWSTPHEQKTSSSSNNTTVTLMDSGNLVLTEYNQLKTTTSLWESFLAPTDTFLPGMKMDESLTLTSWKDESDPGLGDFRFQIGEGKNQFVILNKSAIYWKSDEPGKFFNLTMIPALIVKFLSNFTEVLSNFSEETDCLNRPCFHFSKPISPLKNYSYTRLVINSTGMVQYVNWDKVWTTVWLEPRDRCHEFNVCGDFGICSISKNRLSCKCLPGFKPSLPEKWNSGDFSDGCNRGVKLCGGENDIFLSLKIMQAGNPDSTGLPVHNETECRTECLGNCKCQAYSFQMKSRQKEEGDTGSPPNLCWIWYESLKNLQEYADGGLNLFARVALSDIKSTARNCDPCGTTMIPYPLSTGPNCGDPMYFNFRCDESIGGRVTFKASGREYQVISIDPNNRTFVIQVHQPLENCEARNLKGNLLPKQPSPFNILCNTKDSPIDRDEVEIGWQLPQEPMCNSAASCREWPHSTCSVNATGTDRTKRCYCTTNFKWDGARLNCTGKQEGVTRQPSAEEPSRTNLPLSLIVLPTVIGVVVLLCIVIYFVIWRRNMVKGQENKKLSDQRSKAALRSLNTEKHIQDLMDSGKFKEDDEGIDVPFFNLESILAATDDFSDENKLGQGGYGPVYKGKFPGGQDIAIKRLSRVSGQGLQEFKNEVVLIAKLQHRNLVRLRGYCMERDEKILLYEYMPNKSLDSFIFDDTKSVLLKWETRFDIILGIARGLLYLHQDSRLRIIHRDLKTSNILLDHEMNPKISDFGLARMVGGKETEANTSRVIGTYGYMSPEYALEGVFSVKSDVFSFGVVILEIVSGKRNTKFVLSDQRLSLLGYASRLWTENKVLDLMDHTLSESCKEDQFIKCVNVGLLCVQEDPSDRPKMSNVITMLDSDTATLPSPKQPAFILRRGSGTASSSSKLETHTEITLTMEEAP